jgi:hypothetical protein
MANLPPNTNYVFSGTLYVQLTTGEEIDSRTPVFLRRECHLEADTQLAIQLAIHKSGWKESDPRNAYTVFQLLYRQDANPELNIGELDFMDQESNPALLRTAEKILLGVVNSRIITIQELTMIFPLEKLILLEQMLNDIPAIEIIVSTPIKQAS